MLIDFPDFEDYLIEHDRESILQKGTKFYHEGLIKHIHAFSGTEWDIYVESERPNIPGYTIRVRISNNKVTQVTCNCQGFRFSQLCKHIVASLFVLREKKLYDESIGDYAYEESEEEDEKEKAKEAPASGKKGEKIEEEEQTPAKKKVQTKVNKTPEKSPQEKLETLEKEFECQVCSKPFENPVTLPCNTHSACLKCAESILEEPKEKEKILELKCPSCGKKGGSVLLKNTKELKPNRELERIRHAFEKEKEEWMKEKAQLEKELESLKSQSGKMTEEYRLNKEIHPLDEKTKEAAEAAFFNLKKTGNDADEFLKQIDKNKENEENAKSPDVKKGGRKSSEKGKSAKVNGKTPEKGASKSNTKTNSGKRTHEKQSGGKENADEGAEKYGLRNKKVKSYAE